MTGSQFNFSENAPIKHQSGLNKAWELFDDGDNPTEYCADNPKEFDIRTSNLPRGLWQACERPFDGGYVFSVRCFEPRLCGMI